ncbi:MAG TPA: PAS domain S-box protein [Ignavibacteria bacterium]|nr:PAS domain S-box protein [Ignavibacteria bacterium]
MKSSDKKNIKKLVINPTVSKKKTASDKNTPKNSPVSKIAKPKNSKSTTKKSPTTKKSVPKNFLINDKSDVQWRVDKDFKLIAANQIFLDSIFNMTGVNLNFNESVLLDVFGDEITKLWSNRYSKVLNGENLIFQENFGSYVGNEDQFGIVTMNPLYNDKNQIIGISCISKDISGIIKNINETRNTKFVLEKIMSSANDMICIIDKDGNFKSVNDACFKILGYKPEELIGKNYINFVFKEDLENTYNVAIEIMGGKNVNNYENRYIRKDGSVVPLIWSDNWVPEDELHYSIARDATDIKKFQDDLRSSEEKFRNLFNLSPLPNYVFEPDTFKILDVNQTAIDFYGYSRSEFLNMTILELRPNTEIPKILDLHNDIKATHGTKRFGTFVHRKKNGELVDMNITGQMTDYLGKKCMMVSALDVTEREDLLRKLIDSEKKLTDAAKIAKLGYWNLYLDRNTLEWSDEVYNIWGVDKNNFNVTFESFIKTMHPDDYEEFNSAQLKAFNGDGNLDFVHRIILPNRSVKWVHELGNLIRDENGNPTSLKGTVQDITLRKVEEQSMKLMNKVITNTSDAVMIMEADMLDEPGPKIIYVNKAFSKLTGYNDDEIIGKSPRILNGAETDKSVLANIRKAMENYEALNFDLLCYKKNGDTYWVSRALTPVADEKGRFTHWISVERDITEQKIEDINKSIFADISKIFNKNISLISSLDNSLKYLVEIGKFKFAEYWMLSPDKSIINQVSIFPKPGSENKFSEISKNLNSFVIGEGIPGYVWQIQIPVFCNTADETHFFARREYAKKTGINSIIGIPLFSNDDFIGCILLGSEKVKNILEKQKKFIYEIQRFLGDEIKRKQLEDELNKIFDTTPEIICIAGFDGYFKKINASATKILGYSKEDLINQPFSNFVHPDDRLKTNSEYINLISGNPTIYFENRYISKEGKIVWLSWTVTPVIEEKLMYCIAKDITEHRKIKNLLDDASELAKIGSWEIDLLENKIYSSDFMKKLYEVPIDYVISPEEGILFHKEGPYRDNMIAKVADTINTGKPLDTESIVVTKSGKELNVRVFGKAEIVDGKCIRIFGCTQDISDIKRAEQNLENSFKEKNEILESIGDGFFAVDKNWIVTYWNNKAEELLFRKKEEMLGNNLWDIFSDAKELDSYKNYNKAMTTGKAVYFEDFYPPIDRWYEVSAFPSDHGLSVYFKDISDKKIAEKKLIESIERFEKVTLATQDAIWDWDLTNDKLYWGGGFKNLFGYETKKENPTIESWVEHIHPDDAQRVTETIYNAIDNPNVSNWTSEYRFLKADGNICYILDKGFVIRDEFGKGIRMVGAMADITERKEYEVSLKNLTKNLQIKTNELSRSNKELEQFAYVTSHDLQEPLRMITGFLSQLQRKYGESLDDKAHQYIHFAVDGATRMRQIILDLLEFSRANRFDEDKSNIDLNEIVDEICILQRKLIDEKSAVIKKENLPVVMAHKSPLTQIFHNIINNSLKYSKENIPAEIYISATDEGDYWKICVKDNGIGFDEEYFDKIFLIFQRLHNKDKYSGTGMGLAIVKKLVETAGGKIWVKSSPDVGSEFIFTLKK